MTTLTLTRSAAHLAALAAWPIHGSDQPDDPNAAPTNPDGTPLTVEDLIAALQAIVDGADAQSRSLSTDEMQRYEQLETQLRSARRNVEIRSRQQAYTTAVPGGLAAVVHTGAVRRDDTLTRAFESYMRTGHENADMIELRAQATTPGSAGGFLVPQQMATKIVERLKAFGGIATATDEITTATGELYRIPKIDDVNNIGVIAAENAAPTSGGADLVFGETQLGAFKYTAPGAGQLPLAVSVELLQDSAFDIQKLVESKLGERIGRAQSAHWVNGLGTTQPLGISVGGTAVDINTFDGASISYDDLVRACHQVDPAYRANAVWSFNDMTLALIERLLDSAGRPLLNPSAEGINSGPHNTTLLGYPVVVDQAWANYADGTTNRWGAFGDLKEGYTIRRVAGIQMVVNPYSRASEGKVEYTLFARADGVPVNTAAYRVLVNEVS